MAIKRILIDLDTLLDTRLGVINYINPEAASILTSSMDYWDRENDNWSVLTKGLVTEEQFKEVWVKRGELSAEILNGSVISGITPVVLKILVEGLINQANDMMSVDDTIGVVVNYYPYQLDLDVVEDLRDIAGELFGSDTDLEIVNYKLEDETPAMLDRYYAAKITYHFNEWIKEHHVALGKLSMNCFYFIAPRIYEQDVSKLSVDEKKMIIDMFRIEKLIHMDFDFIDARYFSMIRKEAQARL